LRVLVVILCSALLGLLLAPGKALANGRLGDALWPIPPTQLAHYSAVLVGLGIILWISRLATRRQTLLLVIPSVAVLVATHTRTAILAAVIGLLVAGLSLFTGSKRVRRVFAVAIVVATVVGLPLSSFVTSWAARGEGSSQLTSLTGRTKAWALVLSEPRPETNKLFGSGLSNGSVTGQTGNGNGLSIDSGWISTYQDQGIVGDVLEGAMFLTLLLTAILRPRGPTRALALFLIVYCLVASFTESGMGGASPYLLDLTVAASLLAASFASETRPFEAVAILAPFRARPHSVKTETLHPPLVAARRSVAPATPLMAFRRRVMALWVLVRHATGRLTWGVADQAISSLTNFGVSIYVARLLGATSFGAFSLAYVTYAFALNASRGLATDPLVTRFSGTDVATWRRAVTNCTGTALLVGLVTGSGVIAAGMMLSGTTRSAFLALGLTLPALLLQDSWRFAFFAVGRSSQAFLNDVVWAVALLPPFFLLRMTGHVTVFWSVFAWGGAAGVAALIGAFQARVLPRLSGARKWVSQHRDLGPRYLLEGTTGSAAIQIRSYAVGIILGLAAVGYVQATNTLMGPFMIIFFGMGFVLLPEAVRILKISLRSLQLFCAGVSCGLALLCLGWGLVLLVMLPKGLGSLVLGTLWRPTYPLVVPATISLMGGCVSAGAGTGLHALGAARRSLRAMLLSSIAYVVCGVLGALEGGAVGTMIGTAIATWIGALLFWWQFRAGLREHGRQSATELASAGEAAV
jgi:O-antigen/teichoic acid export membrane protein